LIRRRRSKRKRDHICGFCQLAFFRVIFFLWETALISSPIRDHRSLRLTLRHYIPSGGIQYSQGLDFSLPRTWNLDQEDNFRIIASSIEAGSGKSKATPKPVIAPRDLAILIGLSRSSVCGMDTFYSPSGQKTKTTSTTTTFRLSTSQSPSTGHH